jgi:signal transduction histidine kinase
VHEKSHKLARALIDPDQLRQVFWNLFINAAQSLNGGGEIRVRLEKEKEDFWGTRLPFPNPNKTKEWIKISISDTGAGITPEDKEKIFEPFFTTKEGGTGLGLSIVHKIIENHQGIIQVESEAGKGSTFHVFLPVE